MRFRVLAKRTGSRRRSDGVFARAPPGGRRRRRAVFSGHGRSPWPGTGRPPLGSCAVSLARGTNCRGPTKITSIVQYCAVLVRPVLEFSLHVYMLIVYTNARSSCGFGAKPQRCPSVPTLFRRWRCGLSSDTGNSGFGGPPRDAKRTPWRRQQDARGPP